MYAKPRRCSADELKAAILTISKARKMHRLRLMAWTIGR